MKTKSKMTPAEAKNAFHAGMRMVSQALETMTESVNQVYGTEVPGHRVTLMVVTRCGESMLGVGPFPSLTIERDKSGVIGYHFDFLSDDVCSDPGCEECRKYVRNKEQQRPAA